MIAADIRGARPPCRRCGATCRSATRVLRASQEDLRNADREIGSADREPGAVRTGQGGRKKREEERLGAARDPGHFKELVGAFGKRAFRH
jgi:hypothetical protein